MPLVHWSTYLLVNLQESWSPLPTDFCFYRKNTPILYSGKLSQEKKNFCKLVENGGKLSQIAHLCRQKMPRAQISWRKPSQVATKAQNLQKFSPLKFSCYTVYVQQCSWWWCKDFNWEWGWRSTHTVQYTVYIYSIQYINCILLAVLTLHSIKGFQTPWRHPHEKYKTRSFCDCRHSRCGVRMKHHKEASMFTMHRCTAAVSSTSYSNWIMVARCRAALETS